MSKKLPSLSKLKEFIRDGHARKGLNTVKLAYELFEKLYAEEQQNQRFLNKVSGFFEKFGDQVDDEFENKCLIVFQKDCDNYIEQSLKKKREKFAEREELNHAEINEYKSYCKNCIDKEKDDLRREWARGKGQTLFGVFQIIGTKEGILMTDHYFHHIKSFKGVHYLASPTHVHYLARRKEAIFLYVRVSLSNWKEFIKDLLGDHRPKGAEMYVFTRDCFISESVLQDCENYRIKIVTTARRKLAKYAGNPIVITLEKLFSLCKEKCSDGAGYQFTPLEREYLNSLFGERRKKFFEFPILKNGYHEQIQNNELVFDDEWKLLIP